MSIYPFTDPKHYDLPVRSEVARPCEWAFDIETRQFKKKDGKMYLVYDKEAIKIWLWKLFITVRFRELIYSFDYGSELESLIGQGYTQGLIEAEARRYVIEAVEYNLSDYVHDLEDIQVQFKEGVLTVSFKAITDYGEVNIHEISLG